MPEGNEIHRWAERHAAAFASKKVRVDGPQGRFRDADVIDGRKLQRVMAVGKHLGYDFGKDRILHVHLGLQGDFTEGSGPLPAVRGALRLRMWNGEAVKKAAGPDVSGYRIDGIRRMMARIISQRRRLRGLSCAGRWIARFIPKRCGRRC